MNPPPPLPIPGTPQALAQQARTCFLVGSILLLIVALLALLVLVLSVNDQEMPTTALRLLGLSILLLPWHLGCYYAAGCLAAVLSRP